MLSAGKCSLILGCTVSLWFPSEQGTELGPLCPAGPEPLPSFGRVCGSPKYFGNISYAVGGIRAPAARHNLAALLCFLKLPKSACPPVDTEKL